MAIKPENKLVRNLVVGLLILMAFLFSLSITGNSNASLIDFWKALGSQIIFLLISLVFYSISTYQDTLIGIKTKTFGFSILFGVLAGVIYLLASSFVPFFSIATPILPNSISQSLGFFVVVVVSGIVESIFFVGFLIAYLRDVTNKKKIFQAILFSAFIFSSFHLGAYLTGIYDYTAIQGFSAIGANITVFISAFIFQIIAGLLVYWKKAQSLVIAIVMHMVINFFVYTKLSVIGLN